MHIQNSLWFLLIVNIYKNFIYTHKTSGFVSSYIYIYISLHYPLDHQKELPPTLFFSHVEISCGGIWSRLGLLLCNYWKLSSILQRPPRPGHFFLLFSIVQLATAYPNDLYIYFHHKCSFFLVVLNHRWVFHCVFTRI